MKLKTVLFAAAACSLLFLMGCGGGFISQSTQNHQAIANMLRSLLRSPRTLSYASKQMLSGVLRSPRPSSTSGLHLPEAQGADVRRRVHHQGK